MRNYLRPEDLVSRHSSCELKAAIAKIDPKKVIAYKAYRRAGTDYYTKYSLWCRASYDAPFPREDNKARYFSYAPTEDTAFPNLPRYNDGLYWKDGGFTYRATREADRDPDTSGLGTIYTDTKKVPTDAVPMERRRRFGVYVTTKYYDPESGIRPKDWRSTHTRHDAWLHYQHAVRYGYARLTGFNEGTWCFERFRVIVSVNGTDLADLWSYEFPSDDEETARTALISAVRDATEEAKTEWENLSQISLKGTPQTVVISREKAALQGLLWKKRKYDLDTDYVLASVLEAGKQHVKAVFNLIRETPRKTDPPLVKLFTADEWATLTGVHAREVQLRLQDKNP